MLFRPGFSVIILLDRRTDPGHPTPALITQDKPGERPLSRTGRPVLGVAAAPVTHSQALRVNVRAAMEAIWSNPLRSSLTMLGVIIGVASVIVLIAFGLGAEQEVTSQIDSLGTNVAVIVPGKNRGEPGFNPIGGFGVTNLSHQDVAALRQTRGVQAVAPLMFVGGIIYREGRPAKISLPIGTTPEFGPIRRLKLRGGRYLALEDADQRVCVLGSAIARDLFPKEAAVGKPIQFGRERFTVVGIAEQRAVSGSFLGGGDLDAIVYLPLQTMQQLYGVRQIHRIFVQIDHRRKPGPVLEAVRQAVLRSHGGLDDFSVLTSKDILEMFYKIFNLLAALLTGISSISLIVGGIGIMNIMLVSVTERTREIGIRKTVGARRRDIFLQFLTEAVGLSVLGGLLGIGLAFAACAISRRYSPLTPLITWEAVALGVGVCVGVGILFGVAPAVKAARKDPIEAVRSE